MQNWVNILLLPLLAALGPCTPHKVNNKTVEQMFSDPALARLADAACDGRIGEVKRIIEDGINVNATGEDGATALLWAISCQNLEGMEALLKAGANPNQAAGKSQGNMTPVIAATSYDNPASLELLLNWGGNPSSVRIDGSGRDKSALMAAVGHGYINQHWEAFYLLLEKGADVNFNAEGDTAAILAVSYGYPDKAIDILNHGHDYDLDNLAFHLFLRLGFDEPSPDQVLLMEMLQERGVDIEAAKKRALDLLGPDL